MTDTVLRANQNEAVVNGLVDLLIQHKVVDSDELLAAVQNVRRQIAEAGEAASVGVAIRVDAEGVAAPDVPVDCEARLPVCKAVCCRLRFALSVEEVEAGLMKWDLGRPYYNRQGPDGYCHQSHAGTHTCDVYERAPDRLPPVLVREGQADLEGLRGDGDQPGVDRREPRSRRSRPGRDLHERLFLLRQRAGDRDALERAPA